MSPTLKEVRLEAPQVKRLLALAMGPSLWVLAFDAAVAHLAGKGDAHVTQYFPIWFGVGGGVALLLAGLFLGLKGLSRSFLVIGGLSVLMGVAGSGYHAQPLLADLADEPLNLLSLEGALSVAPPLFAPGAFLGLGVLLVALGLESVGLTFRGRLPLPGRRAASPESLPDAAAAVAARAR